MLSVGKSLSINLVRLRYADKSGGVNALYNPHQIGVLIHSEGDGQNGFRLSRISAVAHQHCGGTSYFITDSQIKLLIFFRHDLCGKGAVAADKYLINNRCGEPGGNYAEKSKYKILYNEQTHHDRCGINQEDNRRAFELFKVFTNNKCKSLYKVRSLHQLLRAFLSKELPEPTNSKCPCWFIMK